MNIHPPRCLTTCPPGRKTGVILSSVLLAAAGLAAAAGSERTPVVPLPRAHSHNDYEQRRPLLDALDQGFCSVEADIYLANGRLLVAHDLDKTRREATLEALYLDPLRQRVITNRGGVYPDGPRFTLLIDIKSDGEPTYRALHDVLLGYTNILTCFRGDRTETNAITVIVSGNRPRAFMKAQAVRYAAYDGRLADLDTEDPAVLIPLVSDNWGQHFAWRGTGPLPDVERQKLQGLVRRAHEQGRQVRFWGGPNRVEFWQELYAAGVDLLNADDLPALRHFLLEATNTR